MSRTGADGYQGSWQGSTFLQSGQEGLEGLLFFFKNKNSKNKFSQYYEFERDL